MKNRTLNETFIKRINKIITEEFGINDALDKEATRATKSIITNINGKDFKWDDESGVYKRYHTVKVTLGEKSVKIYVTNYWFKTVEERDSFLKSAIVPLGYVYEANMLFIPLYSVSDVPFDVDDATDTIYHEIEHFFQTSKMGHNFGSAELYAKAKSNIKSRNETTRAIAEIFYMSFVMDRIQEHYKYASQKFHQDNVIGIFLTGSQNYGTDMPFSDVDTKLLVTPTLDDIYHDRRGESSTMKMPDDSNELISIKDIRTAIFEIKKQNSKKKIA